MWKKSHPVGVGLYYEDQKPEAARSAKQFCGERIPKFFRFVFPFLFLLEEGT